MEFFYKIIDLAHPITSDNPTWDKRCGFNLELSFDYQDCTSEVKFRKHYLHMTAGIGTHLDAPAHCIAGGATIDQINLEQLIAPAVKIDVSDKITPDYLVSIGDLENFEKNYGKVAGGTFVIFQTGWSKFWNNPEKYHNQLLFPTISKQVIELLLERNISGIGIDTLGPDIPQHGMLVHQTLFNFGKYIVENMNNLEKLPSHNFFVGIFPINVKNATEAPARIVGFLAK